MTKTQHQSKTASAPETYRIGFNGRRLSDAQIWSPISTSLLIASADEYEAKAPNNPFLMDIAARIRREVSRREAAQ